MSDLPPRTPAKRVALAVALVAFLFYNATLAAFVIAEANYHRACDAVTPLDTSAPGA